MTWKALFENPNRSWYRVRAHTGPAWVNQQAAKLRGKSGFKNVLEGTEHVHADVLASSRVDAMDLMAMALFRSRSLRGISSP